MTTMKHTKKPSKGNPQKAPAAPAGAAPAAGSTPAASPTPTAPAGVISAPPTVTGVVAGDSKGTKVEVQTSYLALIAGLTQFYQPGDVFSLAEGDLTRDEIIAKLHGFVSEVESTKAANQAWRAQVQVERSTLLEVRPLRDGLKGIVGAKFGKGSPQLVSFGFQPLKATVKSTGSKAAAVAKAEATRRARGTKGSAQKQDITGNVTGVVITPLVAGPAVPAAPPAPKGGGASPQGSAAAGSGS
jgi:hypothetical protein